MSALSQTITKLLPIWLVLGIILIIVLLYIKQTQRAKLTLENWLNQNDFQLTSVERRFFRKGPYLLKSRKGQVIFRISIVNNQHEENIAWVKCGSYFKGAAFSDAIDVTFD